MLESYSHPYNKTESTNVRGEEVNLAWFLSAVPNCGIQIINFEDYKKKITVSAKEITLEKACKVMVSMISISEIKMERIKGNEFRLIADEK